MGYGRLIILMKSKIIYIYNVYGNKILIGYKRNVIILEKIYYNCGFIF